MERCYCRRCLIHDDPGGCLVAEAAWRAANWAPVHVVACDDCGVTSPVSAEFLCADCAGVPA